MLGQEMIGEVIASTDVGEVNINTEKQSVIGDKRYYGNNHLGNNSVTFTDRKLPEDDGFGGVEYFLADITYFAEYYPYGMILRDGGDIAVYTFQGQEVDNSVKGNGNSVNYKYRMHDTRTGRFFAVDPLAAKYPHNSPYAFSENVVINAVELEGLEKWELSNGNTFMETFYGPFSNDYIDEQQKRVDDYEEIRNKTGSIIEKIEFSDLELDVLYPMLISAILIYDVPVTVERDFDFAYAQVKDNQIYLFKNLDKKDESFQVAVFAHEYLAHYLEGIFNLIPDKKNIMTVVEEENPFYDPNKPESKYNSKTIEVYSAYGSIDTAKEEVNGWMLMKALHDNKLINLSGEDYKTVEKNIESYKNKLEKLKHIESNEENGN